MKKIAILGASYLQKPLVEKANQMGIETHCFAWDFGDCECKYTADYFYPISVLEKEEILHQCREIGIDGILSIASDACVPTIAYVAEHLNLISNSFQSSMLSTNKHSMRNAFYENEIKSPKSKTVLNTENLIFDDFKFPLIVKPTDRSGSLGVTKVSEVGKLKTAVRKALNYSIEKKAIVEEYISGSEISVESISWKGKHSIITITDKITTGEPHFVEVEHHQPSTLSYDLKERIRKETIKALDSLKIEYGASHAEFKINDEGEIVVIEVGSRMGGDFIGSHLVQLSTGYDYLKGVIEIALGTFTEPNFQDSKHSGVYFLCKETESLLPFFETDNDFEIEKSFKSEKLKVVACSSERSGYLIYKADEKIVLA